MLIAIKPLINEHQQEMLEVLIKGSNCNKLMGKSVTRNFQLFIS